MKIIDSLFSLIFGKGGFWFERIPTNILRPVKGYKWYPQLHIYDNMWYLYILGEYKSHGFQLTLWDHYKYSKYIDFENPDPTDYNTEKE